jgi:hypothetical protein
MARVLCVLYDDPVDGYPKSYARDDIPQITSYPGGQAAPAPEALDLPALKSRSPRAASVLAVSRPSRRAPGTRHSP